MVFPTTTVLGTHNWCDTPFNKTHGRGSRMFSQAFGERDPDLFISISQKLDNL
jgi:hypothetical protein